MHNPTIVFTQQTMFEILKQSEIKFGLNSTAKMYVTDNNGVLEVQHFAPEEITPGGVPKVTAMAATAIDAEEEVFNLENQMGKD